MVSKTPSLTAQRWGVDELVASTMLAVVPAKAPDVIAASVRARLVHCGS